MSDGIKAAEAIVRDHARESGAISAFLDNYTPGEKAAAHVMVWDHRVIVVGHSHNQAACVAMSSAIQTTAAIARALRTAESVELYKTVHGEPVYDIIFKQGKRSRLIVAALLSSFAGIAKTADKTPGDAMVLTDHRKLIPDTKDAATNAAS